MILVDMILHLDEYIALFIQNYGALTYFILFFVVFIETGCVVTPFLPGDSLIFAAATFAAAGSLHIGVLVVVFIVAAIAGDSVNYWIGQKLGRQLSRSRFVKKEHIQTTEEFYEKYGGRAVIIARFIPIVRTFAPFVAGIGTMDYPKFMKYNVTGSILWVGIIATIGYVFGNIPLVRDHFSLVTIAIIFISILPAIVTVVVEKRKKK